MSPCCIRWEKLGKSVGMLQVAGLFVAVPFIRHVSQGLGAPEQDVYVRVLSQLDGN